MRTRIGMFGCLLPLACLAQTPGPQHFVRASGEATISVKPDRAQISLGVETHDNSAANAVSRNAGQTAAVMSALKQVIGNSGEIATSGYSLQPDLVYPRDGGTPKTTGYKATNTITATVGNLSLVGKLIDSASGAGANNVNSVAFDLKDEQQYRVQALGEAATQARTNGQAIAKALHLEVIGTLEANAAETPVMRPLLQARSVAMAAVAAPSTPIAEGKVDVHARVDITLEVR